MKKFSLYFLLLLLAQSASASHISGGEMYYRYIGPGGSINTNKYEITLRLFRDCSAGGTSVADMPTSVIISIFNNLDDSRLTDNTVNRDFSMDQRLQKIDFSCIQLAPEVCYDVAYFHFEVDLAKNQQGYTASFQTCCRVGGINNIIYNFGSTTGAPGVTFSCNISGTDLLGPTANNSSPIFKLKDTALVCANNSFTLDFGAIDADGDLLSYTFCDAYGCASNITSAASSPSGAPLGTLFPGLSYSSIYSGFMPMGTTVSINPNTGLIQGIAPSVSGRYVIDVCITERRNGRIIGSHRKDFILKVADCNKTVAQLNPQYFTCDGFTLNFSNIGTSVAGTQYQWTFGDPASGSNNTSASATPTHTFTDTGRYTIKLKVSINGICEDSTTSVVRVYPGFFPAFTANSPFCKNVPVQFTDQTSTNYGTVNKWRWDFGNTAAINDTSILKNPTYSYAAIGRYNVTFVVSNSFGCIDTIKKEVVIVDNPPLSITPRDTTYCGLDTLSISAAGTGTFIWTPNYNIIGANTGNPSVYPAVTTKYYVTLNQNGCIGRDSVIVRPANDLSASIFASANPICAEDTITLTATANYTNGISWQWSPVNSLSSSLDKITSAFPSVNTNYILTAKWGKHCVANANQNIVVKPLAVPEAGLGGYICKGQGSLNLQASGGTDYRWEPTVGLSNPNISNPVASPDTTTNYKVFVGVAGCTRKKVDSVLVLVRELPPTMLTNDTLICSIDTLKLNTSGIGSFVWSPNYMISSLSSPFPLVSPDIPTTYYLTLTDAFGCIKKDSVFVDVKLYVTIDAGKDTTICRTDSYQIQTVSDALSYKWTPSNFLDNDAIKRPTATPSISEITYRVIGNIGKCQSKDSVTIKTVPYPKVVAGKDTTVCFGDNAIIYANGSINYNWTPSTYLTSTNTQTTNVIKPLGDIQYIVAGTDTFGCPKPRYDSVWVKVFPKVLASTGIRDTSIVAGQSLQLFGSGGNIYNWSPATGLNNATAQNPIATPFSDIEYKLIVTANPPGCSGRDSVRIKVYQLPPSLYVPTAFSPNKDGLNDIIKPIPLGMKSIRHFKIYNRWGQLIFYTNQFNKGWDGTYKGNPQDPGTFVWEAEAENFKGEIIKLKGTVVLIR